MLVLLTRATTQRALINTFWMGGLAAFVTMLLAFFVSYTVQRTKQRGRGLLEIFSSLPLGFPGMIVGLGLFTAFLYLIPFRPFYGTAVPIIVAIITNYLPHGLRFMAPALIQVHTELEDAARVCGAGYLTRVRKIFLPILKPAFLAGFFFILVRVFHEVSLLLFLVTTGTETVPVAIFQLWLIGEGGAATSISVIVVLVTSIIYLLTRPTPHYK
jgi:iron(III) transport system permease protein